MLVRVNYGCTKNLSTARTSDTEIVIRELLLDGFRSWTYNAYDRIACTHLKVKFEPEIVEYMVSNLEGRSDHGEDAMRLLSEMTPLVTSE